MMRNRPSFRLSLLLIVALFWMPARALAQVDATSQRPLSHAIADGPLSARQNAVLSQRAVRERDSLANGLLIGAGIGAAVGMLLMPQLMCGAHDTECSTIVRAVIGLPSIAGGLGIGAIVDAVNKKDARPAGVAFNVRF
jgi:hypothetical protein